MIGKARDTKKSVRKRLFIRLSSSEYLTYITNIKSMEESIKYGKKVGV